MRSIKELTNIEGKRVLVLVDFNVPIRDGAVEDDFRIKMALPTIQFLLDCKAKIMLVTHLGKDGTQSLDPVIEKFFEISGFPMSEITFFDNVRKFKGEEANDPAFAKELASHGDIYVNEAFSVSHRAYASVVGVPEYLPSYAGFQFTKEVENLSHASENIKHPFLFILGGAKFSTKMHLIQKYLELADNVSIGGALLNDFLKAEGYEVGQSLVDSASYDFQTILKNPKLILADDVVVTSDGKFATKSVNEVGKNEIIADIGEKTIEKLKPLINSAKLILWNGPLGKYEDGGADATKEVLKLVAASGAETIIGGGDTVELITELKMESDFSFVSTGGGAMLDFLANGTLPGIEALN
jgi:phosphoglycerate kinase